jgi:DNA replication licensing factor MCM3
MMEKSEPRLLVKLNHLREFDASLAYKFQRQPYEYLPAFEAALEDFISSKDRNYFEDDPNRQCHLGIDGIFGGDFLVTPRHLLSHFLGSLVCVEGIVTKCSSVLPKVVRTVHYCPATNKFLKKDYRDATSYNGLPTGFSHPTKVCYSLFIFLI